MDRLVEDGRKSSKPLRYARSGPAARADSMHGMCPGPGRAQATVLVCVKHAIPPSLCVCSLSTAYATSMRTQMWVLTHKWFLLYW